MSRRRNDDVELECLAKHLEPVLRYRIEELVAAEGRPVTIQQLEFDLQRQKDLVAEMRRQMESLQRQVDSANQAARGGGGR